MTTLTLATRERAVAALRRAHEQGRAKANGHAWADDGGVCACVVIAEAFGMPEATRPTGGDPARLYVAINRLGFGASNVFRANDASSAHNANPRFYQSPTFDEVADRIAALEVVDEAEQICRDAVLVPA